MTQNQITLYKTIKASQPASKMTIFVKAIKQGLVKDNKEYMDLLYDLYKMGAISTQTTNDDRILVSKTFTLEEEKDQTNNEKTYDSYPSKYKKDVERILMEVIESVSEEEWIGVKMDEEDFEDCCMDLIEEIIGIDKEIDRKTAILISAGLVEECDSIKAKIECKAKKCSHSTLLNIFKRVLEEFEIADDSEYELLHKQIHKK